MNHTPGPWKTLVTNGRKINSALIITSSTAARAIAIDCTKSGDSIKQDEANAELIAAAPDLLEAAESALDNVGDPASWNLIARPLLIAAISKATE